MQLSEAIRLGAMLKPQAFRALFTAEGACALGAALLAVEAVSELGARSVLKRWPWVVTISADCPSCGRSRPVFGIITHLNAGQRGQGLRHPRPRLSGKIRRVDLRQREEARKRG